jgi:hypothetical protein
MIVLRNLTLLAVLLSLTWLISPALAAVPMKLDECIQRGLEYNPEINAYELASEEADRGIEEA